MHAPPEPRKDLWPEKGKFDSGGGPGYNVCGRRSAKSLSELPPYEWIADAKAFEACIRVLRKEPRIALDIESNSLYAYREQVCLIQASVPGHDYIIDPLPDFSLDALGAILKDPSKEKVFHASEYDLILLRRHLGWEARTIFDTMWAARVLGYTRMGLAGFLKEYYGVDQRKRFQKANWKKRPLSAEQLAYAQVDTHYLLDLRNEFDAKLREAGRWDEAQEIFADACNVCVAEREFDPEGFWSLPGARDLNPRQLAILRELYAVRDDEARRRDVPPFKVLANETLVAISTLAPATLEALSRLPGMTDRVLDLAGRQVLDAVARGRKAPSPTPPKYARRHPQIVADRYERLQQWRKNRARARGVESDVVLSRDSMWAIAVHNPRTIEDLAGVAELGPRRLALYGQAILEELA